MDGEAVTLKSAAGRNRSVPEREHVDGWATFVGARTASANSPSQAEASHPAPPISRQPGVAHGPVLTLQLRLLKLHSHAGMIAALAH